MDKMIKKFLERRKHRRASGKINKKILLLNALGFSLVFILSLKESLLYVKILLLIYVLINLYLLLFWNKVQRDIDLLIFSSNAFISFVTSYDYYSHDSRYVYIVYIIIGLFFTIQAIIKLQGRSRKIA